MGLPELVAQTLEDYEALALDLARDPAKLKAVKEKLARNLAAAPLFDANGFRRDIEAAYSAMWETRGETPRSFAVPGDG